MVELRIEVVELLHEGKGLEHKNVVHIEGVFRQFQTALSQKACPVDHGMHKDIVAQTHVSHLFPGEYLFCGHGGVVLHDPFSLLANFVVNIVADEHIDCVRSGDEFF